MASLYDEFMALDEKLRRENERIIEFEKCKYFENEYCTFFKKNKIHCIRCRSCAFWTPKKED